MSTSDGSIERATVGALRLAQEASKDCETFWRFAAAALAECPDTDGDDVDSVRTFIRLAGEVGAKFEAVPRG